MKIKSLIYIYLFFFPFQLAAQVVAYSEGTSSAFKKLLELPDGTLLAGIDANFYAVSYANFTLLKFDNTGNLDEKFANSGKYRYKAPSYSEEEKAVMHVEDMLLLADGKILVTGYRERSSDDIFLLRLLPNGNADSSYGTNGYVFLKETYSNAPVIRLMPVDSKNTIVACIDKGGRIASYSVNENGIPDIQYGEGKGRFKLSVDGQDSDYPWFGNIDKDAKNRLYFTAFCESKAEGFILEIFRVTPEGKLDADFADGGIKKLMTDKQYAKYFRAGNTLFLPDNKILVSAKYSLKTNNVETGYHHIFKLNENGSPDTSFSKTGMTTFTIAPRGDDFTKIEALPDGKIMAYAIATLPQNASGSMVKVLVSRRLNKNGQPDKTFGKNGVALNTLFIINGEIDLKGLAATQKNFYAFGHSYAKIDNPWISTIIKLNRQTGNKLAELIKSDFVYSETNETAGAGILLADVVNSSMEKGNVTMTRGNTGAKQPTQEERNLLKMIETLAAEAGKVRTAFTTFDNNQMSGNVISTAFVTNGAALTKAMAKYIDLSNTFAGGKYSIRNIWKNYIPLSLFTKREQELQEEMKNLSSHIDKCIDYIDKFTKDNRRMPAGVGNYMEMADYKFAKKIDEFLSTYKSIYFE